LTVLVATFDGVWADRRITGSGGHIFPPHTKLIRGDGLVAGFCGDNSACAKAMRAVRDGETDVQLLAEMCDGLVVNARGRWELSGKLAAKAPRKIPFLTNGSGWSEASSFLVGRGSYTPADVKAAIQYVGRVRYDCGDGVNGLMLNGKE